LSATVFPFTFSGGNWLSVTANSVLVPGTVTVTANTSGLGSGTYGGALVIGALGANNSIVYDVSMVIGIPNASTDRLYVGQMTTARFAELSGVPLPSVPDQKFCAPVRLAPDMLAWAYVPTAAERSGDFSSSAAAALLVDPVNGSRFSGGIIPASRLPNPYAWRIAASGPAPGENCMQSPSNLPQFASSYYVTGRNTALDQLIPNALAGTVYQIGDPYPPEQAVSISSRGSAVDFLITPPSPTVGVDSARWLKIAPPNPCCTTPASLRVAIQPLGLLVGSYTSVVNIVPLGAIGLPAPIAIGVSVKAPANWITVDPPTLHISYQPGTPLPLTAGQFKVTIQEGRAYTVIPRVISPTGGSWVGVAKPSGTSSGPVDVQLTSGALNLAPGSYVAVIDIVAGSNLALPQVSFGTRAAATGSGLVCGGGLSTERVVILLTIGTTLNASIAPTLQPDPRDGYPTKEIAYIDGKLQEPGNFTFQPVGMNSNTTFDVKTVVRNPDPENTPGYVWLSATPSSVRLGDPVTPILDQSLIGKLVPCDYEGYVAISNSGTGAAFRVKFTVLSSPTGIPPNVTKVMSQIADGGPAVGGWRTTIILVNTDLSNSANFQLLFHPSKDISPDTPFNVIGPGQMGNRVYLGSIPAGGSVTLNTRGTGAPLWQGWAELTAPDSVGGTAIFAQALNAASDAEGAVLLKPVAGTTFLLPFENNSTTGLLTTIALVNPSATSEANITVTLRGESGNLLGQSPISLGRSGHEAFDLLSHFPGASLANQRGVAEFTSDVPITGLGLRFNQKQHTFTSFEIATPQTGGMLQAIAHIVDGGPAEGAWKTSITLVNLDTTQYNTVTLIFHGGQDGAAGQALLLESGESGTHTVVLNPGGSATVVTSGGTQLWQGWAEVKSSAALGGFAVFQQAQKSGQIEGTVSFSPQGQKRFVVPFDNTGATGLAIVNASDQPSVVTANFRDPAGASIPGIGEDRKILPLDAADHKAFSISDPQAPLGGTALAGQLGTIDFTATSSGLIGIGLRFSPRNAFTSLPVILK
jgi:hypothetical protein